MKSFNVTEMRMQQLACRASSTDKTKVRARPALFNLCSARQYHLQVLEELTAVMKLQGKIHECVSVHEELVRHLLALPTHGARSVRTLKQQVC